MKTDEIQIYDFGDYSLAVDWEDGEPWIRDLRGNDTKWNYDAQFVQELKDGEYDRYLVTSDSTLPDVRAPHKDALGEER